MFATQYRAESTETKMNYLSNVANQRPMLHVTRDILLAFGFATPLLLLLCFLI
jgi:hypothetical protein